MANCRLPPVKKQYIYHMKHLYLLFVACVLGIAAQGQNVPNADFESWQGSSSYEEPTSWVSTNQQFGSLPGGVGITKSPDSHGGTYAASIATVNIGTPSTAYTSILTNGSLNNGSISGGSPTTIVPDTVFFYYKYSTTASSAKGRVLAFFFHRNGSNRDTVGFAQLSLPPTATYAKASVAIGIRDTLHHTNLATDSVLLVFLSSEDPSHPEQGTLLVDDITFGNAYVGIEKQDVKAPQLTVYPNPVVGEVQINLEDASDALKTIRVYSADGRLVQTVAATGSQTKINTAGWAKANYLLQIETSKGAIVNRQIAKQ